MHTRKSVYKWKYRTEIRMGNLLTKKMHIKNKILYKSKLIRGGIFMQTSKRKTAQKWGKRNFQDWENEKKWNWQTCPSLVCAHERVAWDWALNQTGGACHLVGSITWQLEPQGGGQPGLASGIGETASTHYLNEMKDVKWRESNIIQSSSGNMRPIFI